MSEASMLEQDILSPGWYLYDGSIPVCTFIPKVVTLIKVITPEGEFVRQSVQLNLCFKSGDILDVTVLVSELDRIDWFQVDSRCVVNSKYRFSYSFLSDTIRTAVSCAPVEIRYSLDRLGIHHINDTVVFAAGDRVITRSLATEPELKFELDQLSFSLDIDPDLTVKDTFTGMRELISLSPEIGRVLVAHVISGITRAAFKEAGFVPCAVLVVVGESGMLKSHYVPHIVQLYDRSEGIGAVTRFNSTSRFIEDALFEHSECTAIIDDLHTAESKGIRKRNESTAEEVIRRISDDTGRGRMDGKSLVQKKFRGNAVFIGEYSIGKASTIPRALIVNLTQRPNGAILDRYQRGQKLLVSTFYYYFIQWYVDHFDDIRSEIDKRLTTFRKDNADSETHGRLSDTMFYLLTAYMLFLEFCKDAGCCSEQDVMNEYLDFKKHLTMLISEQQARFRQDKQGAKDVNYLKLIRKLHKGGAFHLADNVAEFDPEKHDGLIYYDCLCLRGERISKQICKIFPTFNLGTAIKALLDKGALKQVANKHTVQISGYGGLRFYAIWLHKLE